MCIYLYSAIIAALCLLSGALVTDRAGVLLGPQAKLAVSNFGL